MLIRHITGIAIGLAVLSGAAPARAGHFSDVFAFGDSLSDVGNLYAFAQEAHAMNPQVLVFPLPPYSNGQFSNGPVWVQDLAVALGNGPLTPAAINGNDYAVGGAQSGLTYVNSDPYRIDLPDQLIAFLADHSSAPSNALYTLSVGGNDLLAVLQDVQQKVLQNGLSPADAQTEVEHVAQQAVSNIAGFAAFLAVGGAHNFLVMNVPDLGVTPYVMANGAAAAGFATAASRYFNTYLATVLAQVGNAYSLNINIIDSFSLIDNIVANPAGYGFTDATTPCWPGDLYGNGTTCAPSAAAQDTYLFWDQEHPTESGHALIAKAGLELVAEPATAWLMAPALLGLAALYRRRGQAI